MVTVTMVGRERELAVLAAEQATATSAARAVLVVGEAGAGKSRLVEEFTGGLDPNVTVLSARAAPLGNSEPMGLWAEAIDGHLRGMSDEEVVDLCDGAPDDLGRISRRAAAIAGRLSKAPPRHRLFEAVATLLARLADRGPVVVTLDDTHLADASSWEAIHWVVNGLTNRPVLVLATARSTELAGHASGRSIAFALEQQGRLRRVPIGPLDEEALRCLIADVISAPPRTELVQWVTQRSRGNVLFALGLIHALVEEGADLTRPALRRLPESLTARVTDRVDGLDEAARSVVDVLAVLGRPGEAGMLAALLGEDRLALDALLAGLEHSGLVTEQPGSRAATLEITHPLVAEAVYGAIPPAARRVRHRAIARHLLTEGRTVEAAMHFAKSCGGHADGETKAALCDALREAEEREAEHEALEILETLSELLPSGDRAWAEVAAAMQWTADWVIDHRADNSVAGIAAIQQVADVLATSPDRRLRGAVHLRQASFLGWGDSRPEEAQAHCRQAVLLFEEAGDPLGALLARNELAWTHILRGSTDLMAVEAEQVLAEAERAGEPMAIMQASITAANAALFQGRFVDAENWLRRSHALAVTLRKGYEVSRINSVLALSLAGEGRMTDALLALAEARSGLPGMPPVWEPFVHWLAGRTGRTLASLQEALAFRPIGPSRRRAVLLDLAALAAADADDLTLAARYLDEADVAYRDRPLPLVGDYHQAAAAVVAWRRTRDGGAPAALKETTDRLLSAGILPLAVPLLTVLAEVASEADALDLAFGAAHEARKAADALDRPFHQAAAAYALACAELAHTPSGASSVTASGAGLDLLGDLDYPGMRARLLYVLGRASAPTDRPVAIEALTKAATLFAECGASRWRNDTLKALRRLRGRVARSAGAILGPASLTAREREVARLASQGATAAQIAERLILGRRTVEGHLATVYAKLGVGSRAELARRADELLN